MKWPTQKYLKLEKLRRKLNRMICARLDIKKSITLDRKIKKWAKRYYFVSIEQVKLEGKYYEYKIHNNQRRIKS